MKIRRLMVVLVLLGAGVGCYGYFSHFDTLVQNRFQGRLWELPARVYARPLEIYPGMHLSPDLFEKELDLLGYRPGMANAAENPGRYSRRGNQFTVFLRAFDFGDETLGPRRIHIRIKDTTVEGLRRPDTFSDREMERIDPVVIGSFYPDSREDRVLVSLDHIPKILGQTIVAVEDRNFYTHYGIDPKSILRAVAVNLKNQTLSQGASTLTQQLAKNFFLTPEKTLIRKINEAFTALALELRFSKDEILEAYINEVYLGQDGDRAIHGFGLAADFYFGRSLADLKPHEIALLVGMLKGPSAYNPRQSPQRSLSRRNVALELMADQGLISPTVLKQSLAAPLDVIEKPVQGHSPFPYYLDLVKRQLIKEYRDADLKTMGLRIFTALDPQVQLAAEQGTAGFLNTKNRSLDAGVVVTALATNEILAVVGGKNFRHKGFNRALDARRPIGSLVKPAVFLTALLDPGAYTMITPVDDGPVRVENPDGSSWTPQNFDEKSHDGVRLYQALVHSYNRSTVRLGMDIGLDAVAATLSKMGHPLEDRPLPSMLLGSLEMSPVQVAQLYHTLASEGFYIPAKSIRTVYTPESTPLSRYPLTIEQRLDPGGVFLLNKMLQAVVSQGTGRSLEKWIPREMAVAGKTGTTNSLRDSWFAGFSGNHLAVVWVGRDDNQPAGLTGSTGALQLFGRIMAKIPNTPLTLAAPGNVEWGIIDPLTGALTHENCPDAMAVPFLKGSAPDQFQPCTPESYPPSKSGNGKNQPRYLIDWLKDIFK